MRGRDTPGGIPEQYSCLFCNTSCPFLPSTASGQKNLRNILICVDPFLGISIEPTQPIMQTASNCLRPGRQLQQGHTPLPHRAVQHSSRLAGSVWHARPSLPLLHTSAKQQTCRAQHRGSIRAAAAPAVVPVSVAAAASFPALQHALAPVLPYIMAAAAACCAALVALVSRTMMVHARAAMLPSKPTQLPASPRVCQHRPNPCCLHFHRTRRWLLPPIQTSRGTACVPTCRWCCWAWRTGRCCSPAGPLTHCTS